MKTKEEIIKRIDLLNRTIEKYYEDLILPKNQESLHRQQSIFNRIDRIEDRITELKWVIE